jgi:hypothetical protein
MSVAGIQTSLLRPVRTFLRKALIRRRVYTPCCASCGEMPTGLEKRLCASLSASFPVDAVLVPAAGAGASAFARSITGLQKHCPWLRFLFLLLEGEELPDCPSAPATLRPIRKRDFPASAPDLDPVWSAHAVPGLSEHYLIVTAGAAPERDMLPQDFFTPNGIPFVFLDATGTDAASPADSGIFAQTRENSADFLAGLACPPYSDGAAPPRTDCRDYFTAAGRWASFSGRAVPLYR